MATPPKGPLWQHEVKYDGYRILARAGEGRVRLWSRNTLDWTARLPRIAEAVSALPVASVVLDGEAITEDHLGRPDFHGLRSVIGLNHAVFVVWDLLEFNGYDTRGQPLSWRRARLDELLPEPVDGIIPAEVFCDGRALFRHACALNLEGVVSKRLDSQYRSGRALTWLKAKCEGYCRRDL
ncbi:hypothetical protein WDZ92_07190 [Nostoc sp. NIES-2111]